MSTSKTIMFSKSRTILQIFKKLPSQLYYKNISSITKLNPKYLLPVLNQKPSLLNPYLEIIRYKHKDSKKSKKQAASESEEDETEDFENDITDKQTKLITAKVNSLRADLILKAGLGIARNKIETMFYESKIRVNGQVLAKKSSMLSVGDEIDIVRGSNAMNPDFLTVSRVEILSASEKDEGLSVKLRRNKALTIENYDSNPVS